MYLNHFGLTDFPFIQSGKDELYFVTPPARRQIVRLQHWLDCGHDFLLLSGQEGSGREALVHRALNEADFDIRTVTVCGLTFSDTDFLQYIALELGIKAPGSDLMILRHAIKTHLKQSVGAEKRVCIVILQAEKLPASQLALLQDICRAAEYYLPLCSVVLVGDQSMAKPSKSNSGSRQNSVISVHLQVKPLTLAMTKDYLRYRMNLVAVDETEAWKQIFPDSVIQQVFEQSGGNLASINRLADTLLMAAWAQASPAIESKHVVEAARLLGWGNPTKSREKKSRKTVSLTERSKVRSLAKAVAANKQTTVHQLEESVTTIGRSADCTIRINEKGISPCQALIVKTGDDMFIRNEGADVPLYLNAAKVDSAALRDGDKLRIGDYEMSLTKGGDGSPVLVSAPSLETPA